MTAFTCSHCKTENKKPSRTCRSCGTLRPEAVSEVFLCTGCLQHIRHLDRYCMWCGQRVAIDAITLIKTCPGCDATLSGLANFCQSCGRDVRSCTLQQIRIGKSH